MTTQLVSLGACGYRVVTRFPTVMPRRLPRLPWPVAAPHLGRAFWVSVSQIAQVLLYATDIVIVAWMFGPVTVVPYACTQKLISVLSNQPQILTQAAAPALSELRMGADRGKFLSVTSSLSLALMIGSGAVLVVVLAVNRAFVSWWVGADQYGGATLTALFGVAMVVRHWNVALVYALFSFGHERRISLTTVADGIVSLALSLALARTVGVIGVPLGFLAGALLRQHSGQHPGAGAGDRRVAIRIRLRSDAMGGAPGIADPGRFGCQPARAIDEHPLDPGDRRRFGPDLRRTHVAACSPAASG